ncbi:MAG: hypothetical protein ACRD2N_10715 [Vicinamibacterales bacterium]
MEDAARPLVRLSVPAAGVLLVMLVPAAIEAHARYALAITVGMVLCWIVDALHPAIVGVVGCFLFRATGVAEFETAFAGFGSATPWLLYGALALFSAADRGGVIAVIGAHSPTRLTQSLVVSSIALVIGAYVLGLIVPSSLARATMLAFLAVGWSSASGQAAERTTWLVLVATYAATVFGRTETTEATAPLGWNIVMMLILSVSVVWLSKRSTKSAEPIAGSETPSPAGALNGKVAALVVVAIGLWVTTPLHGLSPALVGLGAGLAASLPGIVSVTDRRPPAPDPLAIVLAGTALSIPVVLTETHAAAAVSQVWLTWHRSGGMLPQELVSYWTMTLHRLLSPDGLPPGLPPIDAGGNPIGADDLWAVANSTLVAIYQSPALVLGLSVGSLRQGQVLILGLLVLAAGSVAVMLF